MTVQEPAAENDSVLPDRVHVPLAASATARPADELAETVTEPGAFWSSMAPSVTVWVRFDTVTVVEAAPAKCVASPGKLPLMLQVPAATAESVPPLRLQTPAGPADSATATPSVAIAATDPDEPTVRSEAEMLIFTSAFGFVDSVMVNVCVTSAAASADAVAAALAVTVQEPAFVKLTVAPLAEQSPDAEKVTEPPTEDVARKVTEPGAVWVPTASKVMVWGAFTTLNEALALPARLTVVSTVVAVMVQTPTAIPVTELPLRLHTDAGPAVSTAAPPDETVAETVADLPATKSASAPMVMVTGVFGAMPPPPPPPPAAAALTVSACVALAVRKRVSVTWTEMLQVPAETAVITPDVDTVQVSEVLVDHVTVLVLVSPTDGVNVAETVLPPTVSDAALRAMVTLRDFCATSRLIPLEVPL